MYNPAEDNEIDAISREAAREYRSPGSPDWDAMQTELEKVMPEEKKKKRFFFFWWLLPLMMAVGLGWWLNREGAPLETNALVPGKIQVNADKASERKYQPEKELTNNNTAHPSSGQIAPPLLFEKTKTLPASKIYTDTRNGLGNTGQSKQMLTTTADNPTLLPEKYQEQVYSLPPTPEKNPETKSQQPVQKNSDNVNEQKVADNNSPAGNSLTENNQLPADTLLITEKKTNNKTTLLPVQKGWSLALLTGIDKSTVKFKYGNDAGYSIGMIAGFHFNEKWSIHSGAIYTTKNYKLDGKDFNAPKGSWASYYKIETIDGYCNMWEVPLQVRYRISGSAKNSISLNTGLSSYFMNREFYNYFYYNNGVPTNRSNAYPSSDTHVLSIGHLSVVFDKRISNTLSFQWEPYAKIPFSGVGLGNIQLSSFGINLSLAYRHSTVKPISKK